MTQPRRIPIQAARDVADRYGYDQVIIYARKTGEGGMEHMTTYGKTREHCTAADFMGQALKRFMGWNV